MWDNKHANKYQQSKLQPDFSLKAPWKTRKKSNEIYLISQLFILDVYYLSCFSGPGLVVRLKSTRNDIRNTFYYVQLFIHLSLLLSIILVSFIIFYCLYYFILIINKKNLKGLVTNNTFSIIFRLFLLHSNGIKWNNTVFKLIFNK